MNEPSKSRVHVYKTSPQSLHRDVDRALEVDEFRGFNPTRRTYIKINMNHNVNWPGCNTSKWFLKALLNSLRERGFTNLTAVEGDLKFRSAVDTLVSTGNDLVLREYGVEFLPLEGVERIDELPVFIDGAQLISTPVLHTHTFATISVATKNLFGLLPVYREVYHNILSEKLLELAEKVKVFTVVDGTVSLEGGSMRIGTPIKTDLILSGTDPIAIDAIAARIMGFSLEEVPMLRLARQRGIVQPTEVHGDFTDTTLPEYHFRYAVARLARFDLWLRSNEAMKGFFHYGSLGDQLANLARLRYTSIQNKLKMAQVSDGPWREYEEGSRT